MTTLPNWVWSSSLTGRTSSIEVMSFYFRNIYVPKCRLLINVIETSRSNIICKILQTMCLQLHNWSVIWKFVHPRALQHLFSGKTCIIWANMTYFWYLILVYFIQISWIFAHILISLNMYIYIQSAFSEEHLYNIRNKFSDENGNNSIFSNNCINCANNVAICIIISLHLKC